MILSRWLTHRDSDAQWGWNGPRTKLVSLYAAQFNARDIARKVCQEHDLPLYDDVRGALTTGSGKLAVDAVLLIGEHGEYPLNELGQTLYPRKELFDKIVKVFSDSGRSVPVFCDKHFSWNFDWAKEMVQTARQMGFMLIGGSSIPHTRHRPAIPSLRGRVIKEAVGVHYSDLEAYGFHGLEFVQGLIEQRAGGERGIRSITALRGDEVWKAQDRGRWSGELAQAAVAAIAANDPKYVKEGDMRENCAKNRQPPAAFIIEHNDGLQVTHLNLTGHVENWSAAFAVEDQTLATAATMAGEELFFPHFATLSRLIEDAFVSGRPPFPIERTLLTTGATAGLMRAVSQPGVTIPTPELAIAYEPGEIATVWG